MSTTTVVTAPAATRALPTERLNITRSDRDVELHSLRTASTNRTAHPPADAVTAEVAQPLSRDVLIKIFSAGFAFFVAGVNDGSLGALVPYLLQSYEISTGFVSIVYGCTFCGFLLSAIFNSHVMLYLGMGAIIAVGASLQLIANALRAWMSPFGLFAFSFFLTGAGMAFQDSQSNTFVSTVKGAHRWLSFIHGMYGVGLLVGPFVATAIASHNPEQWYLFYVFPAGLSCLNVASVLLAFRDSLSVQQHTRGRNPVQTSTNKAAFAETWKALTTRGLWQLSLFYLFHLGTGITVGGWIVEYLVRVKHGELSKMGYVSAGYNGGFALGRFLLSEPTHRFGERRMLIIYSIGALGLQLVSWLVPGVAASIATVGIMGFLLGPFFATGMSVATKLFPKDIQPSAISLVFVFSQIGGAGFPALTGIIASEAGVQVLQPILVGLIVAQGVSWAIVPKVSKHSE